MAPPARPGVRATHLRTIPRALAHRHSVAEVFVTSLAAEGEDSFVAGAQLPRMHGHYGDHAGALADHHDLIAVMEAARQASIAVTHEFYEVPTDRAFLVRTFNGSGIESAAWEVGFAPADLELRVRALRKHDRGEALQGLDLVLDISCGGVAMGTVDGSFSWVDPRQWAGIRAGYRKHLGLGPFETPASAGPRAAAALVGRENPRNVVIGVPEATPSRARAAVIADTTHPILFDHQLDHVPGNLLIEACRQTALTTMGPDLRRLLSVTSAFDQFVELDLPAVCVAERAESAVDTTVVHCEIRQAGGVAARIDLEFAASSREDPRR
ncbi:gamma-butyrolactone biosynthesis protein [Nocardia seriolae]|nr:gamma-butyrolactone biosynthesis protein [Nocardia seriolae]MTJ71156.1 gamma-butyrolactone biosynthesis protein [Nocardia seriolae]MTJ88919.1 gamma-butyrolactone biosynthesis protein [Nocardia seriolae]MTK32898.1 gamma-butyrolactone biosynthesis protein [Nocardia seriolae]MTK41172.1 gamma-butyrolactone biosynthesis protein [Nocardia seriolae]